MATFELQADDPWPGPPVDPYLRLAVALIEKELGHDGALLGIGCTKLNLLVELKEKDGKYLLPRDLGMPDAYKNKKYVTGFLALGPGAGPIRERIAALRGQVARLKLAVCQQPRLAESLEDMGPRGVPLPWKAADHRSVDGSGVVIGIIDDGCAFAHYNFLKRTDPKTFDVESRILHLWDQTPEVELSGMWTRPEEFGYGRALSKEDIDVALTAHVDKQTGYLREDALYKDLGYAIDVGSHGTHVMDIAAGNANAGGSQGVAPKADIIFVQIPKTATGNPADSVLTRYLLDGITYIFAKAAEKPAVVNISYGGYGGPHDGTSLLECAIDEILEKENDRAVVVSAGNSFDVDCHASGQMGPQQDSPKLRWLVPADDPTLNMMEIWYGSEHNLKLRLVPPDQEIPLEIMPGGAFSICQEGKIVGWVFHRKGDSGKNKDNHILIALRPCRADATDRREEAAEGQIAAAPSGTWLVQLHNEGQAPATFHAWIERDDAGSRKAARKLQSRFARDDASPQCTLGSFATGKYTISVGGYNTATQEVCSYSACGPTRDNRSKPDVCAPAETDGAGDGVLSATSLSSQPTRMNGTSVAAPHVAGLVALVFEATRRNGQTLKGYDIRQRLMTAASASPKLKPNSRSPASGALLDDCTGAGKVNAWESLKVS